MLTIWVYIVYVTISVGFTVWVAATLRKSGRVFLLDACQGREALADSTNHLLNVGFYLINVGYVLVALKLEVKPSDAVQAMEVGSTKLGYVLLVLGAMHFFTMWRLARARSVAVLENAPLPVAPDGRVGVPVR